MLRIAFLASNNGSSFRAIVSAIQNERLDAVACILISNRATASALPYAGQNGIPHACIPTQNREAAADEDLLRQLQDARADIIILSGYLKKLGPKTLEAFQGRILNVHPALLPKFGGQGMYGRRVHQAVLEAGETVTGATVHLADGEYDHGRIIANEEVAIHPSDDVESIERKVLEAESSLLTRLIAEICMGRLSLPL